MTTTTEVTQDEAYEFLKRCAERESGVAMADMAAELTAFRAQALAQGRLEGVEAGLDAAIKAADKICDEAVEEGDDPDYDEGSVWASMATLSELRAIKPATIANQIGEK